MPKRLYALLPRGGSFTLQVALRFAALVTATTAIVLAGGGWLLDRQIVRSLETLHELEFDELREMIGPNPALTAEEIRTRIRTDTEADAALYYIQLHNDSGTVLFRSSNLGDTVLPDLAGGADHWTAQVPSVGAVRISEFHFAPWHMKIASPVAPLRRLLKDYLKVSGLLLALVTVTSVGLGYGFARLTLRPVRAIRETALRIRGDHLSERIPVPAGRDEFVALVELLNQMFDRLEASFRQVRGFSATASHELKTPLSLIRLNAEKLQRHFSHDPIAQSALGDLMEETSRLHRLIESLLFLAKAGSGALAIELKAVDAKDFLHGFTEDAQLLAHDRTVVFQLSRNEAGLVRVEPNLIRQLLLNLLSNALAVSPKGSTITLESWIDAGLWHLRLTDEGPGLPSDQLNRVFEQFARYRHTQSEEVHSGTGLGLAICRSIADLHGGTIHAENRTERSGLRLVVSLPAL
jgi:signal transduction histidine kinase